MKLGIYCVYDSVGLRYGNPMFIPTVGDAVRGFSDVVNDPQTMLYKHPADYTLFHVAEFDDQTGGIEVFAPMRNLGGAASFKKVLPSVQMPKVEVVSNGKDKE